MRLCDVRSERLARRLTDTRLPALAAELRDALLPPASNAPAPRVAAGPA